ncbi:MAG: amidohydrolase [Gemmataceae bacterium]|nr:amidohydrolase [Gemmataceae bacterium]
MGLMGLLALFAADLIIRDAKVVTLDAKSSVAQAVAVRAGKIVAVGTKEAVLKLKEKGTRVIDAKGMTLLPGLYDSHVHPVGVVTTELADPPPVIRSLKDAFARIREQAKKKKEGDWIVLRYVFPTRLDEARFPTLAELDAVAPRHPVLFHAGPASMVNTAALRRSGITRETKSPPDGMLVKDARGEPTGMIRNAYSLLKGVPREGDRVAAKDLREGVRKLFALYNEQGITSIADRAGSKAGLDLYRSLAKAGELTVRVNCSRGFDPGADPDKQLDRLEKEGGPTGHGDDLVRTGPLKLFLDGGMLNGTAYMRQPWPPGPTYQVTEKDYRGLLFIKPERLADVVLAATRRKWQVTAHTAGEAAMDHLLDAYAVAHRRASVKDLRLCITHANFPSKDNLARCKEMGVVADVQPAWLYKDGSTLAKVLPKERMRWFQPYKSWLAHTVIGGGSDHMLRYDSLDSTNPWNPWLGIWTALARKTERAGVLLPEERLTREQALRMYTMGSAFICHEEKAKGSIEVGKLADLVLIDRDILACPVEGIKETKAVLTVVDGKIVHQRKE